MITVFLKRQHNSSLEFLSKRYLMLGYGSLFGQKQDLATLFLQLFTANPDYFDVQEGSVFNNEKIPPSRDTRGNDAFLKYVHRYWVILNLEIEDLPSFYQEKKCLVGQPMEDVNLDNTEAKSLSKYLHCFGIDLMNQEEGKWVTVQTKVPKSIFAGITGCAERCTIS